jgi:hypothetical protein
MAYDINKDALSMSGLCKRKNCMYHSKGNTCDYRLMTGAGRGCPVGEACDKYKEGDRRALMRKRSDPGFVNEKSNLSILQ